VNGDDPTVSVAASVLDAMIAHARREAPNECCGLLVGGPGRIDRSVPANNIAPTPATRYEIDPREHIALNREVRGSGQEVIGVYHSHPRGPARPSASDLAEAFYPDFLYIIVSLEDAVQADIRAFSIKDGRAILRSFQSS
jgi:proteasome lid subunit RPN8/RPN11